MLKPFTTNQGVDRVADRNWADAAGAGDRRGASGRRQLAVLWQCHQQHHGVGEGFRRRRTRGTDHAWRDSLAVFGTESGLKQRSDYAARRKIRTAFGWRGPPLDAAEA